MTLTETLAKGGPVVWALAGYSVIGFTLVFERLIRFLSLGRLPKEMDSGLRESLMRGEISPLLSGSAPEVNILRGVLEASAKGVNDLASVASRVGSDELQRMERGFGTLAFLGNTAPLLGLLGTITGMIKAFMVIEQAGGRVDAQALAGGIWEALITTGVGLAISLPLLFMLHLLEGMVDRRAHAMRYYASMLVEQLLHLPHQENFGEAPVRHRNGEIHAL